LLAHSKIDARTASATAFLKPGGKSNSMYT